MLYERFLKIKRPCPFCYDGRYRFREGKSAYLTYALAPYAKYHLLVIPKRHIVSLADLRPMEGREITSLISQGIRSLKEMGVKTVTVLVRDGAENSQKSIAHLHYHIIPNHRIGDLDSRGKPRRMLSEREVKNMAQVIKKRVP